MLRNTLQTGAVGPDEINVGQVQALPPAFRRRKIAFTIRGEGDPFAVRRPRRPEVAAAAGSQRRGFASGGIKDPEIGGSRGPRRDEDNLFANG